MEKQARKWQQIWRTESAMTLFDDLKAIPQTGAASVTYCRQCCSPVPDHPTAIAAHNERLRHRRTR